MCAPEQVGGGLLLQLRGERKSDVAISLQERRRLLRCTRDVNLQVGAALMGLGNEYTTKRYMGRPQRVNDK